MRTDRPFICPLLPGLFLGSYLIITSGCGVGELGKNRDDFFTSGSLEADQRASQKMARAEQLAGSESADEKASAEGVPIQAEEKLALFDRLGGESGVSKIVADFLPRVLNDPRINWQRRGITTGGIFRRDKSVAWNPSPEKVAVLQEHLVQFLSLATGGPAQYDGKDIKSTHANMRITNPEFDAAIGDLKASLDNLQVRDREQKELLAIVESTRPQIVTER